MRPGLPVTAAAEQTAEEPDDEKDSDDQQPEAKQRPEPEPALPVAPAALGLAAPLPAANGVRRFSATVAATSVPISFTPWSKPASKSPFLNPAANAWRIAF